MKQPKYSPQDALERIKLMMKYDTSKTLNENKQVLKEQYVAPTIAAGTTGAALGAGAASTTTAGASIIVPVMSALGISATAAGAVVGGAAALAVLPLAYWLITKDTGANKVKKMFEMCSSESVKIDKLPRKMSDQNFRNMLDNIEDALNDTTLGIKGGTDEEKLFSQFKQFQDGTASDFCAFLNYYNNRSDSGNLFEDLDDDIDSEEEWKQIYRPIRNCVEDSLLTIGENKKEETQPTVSGWEKFPCVPTLANQKGVKMSSNGSFLIGNFRYFANGRKGNITSKETSYYTCNDPEFVAKKGGRKTGSKYKTCSEQLPIKFGCKNETIKYIQGPECLGITADGKFGPNTKQALIDKGENGDQIDSGTIIAVCKRSTSTIQPDEITLVDAEDSTKLIE